MLPTPERICPTKWVGQAALFQVRSCQPPECTLLPLQGHQQSTSKALDPVVPCYSLETHQPFVNVLAAWLDWGRSHVMTDSASYLVKQNMGTGPYRI